MQLPVGQKYTITARKDNREASVTREITAATEVAGLTLPTGSWFNEAFIGTMGGLMKKLEDPSYHYMNSVEDAYHTMCVVEACYKSNAEGGTPVEYGR